MPRFDTFGDIVLLQGFIKALLDFLPEARITLLVREGYDQLAALFPERLLWKTTRIHPYKKPSDPEEITSLLEELKKESYDLLLTTTYNCPWPDELLAATLSSAWRVAIGDARPIAPDTMELCANFGGNPPENRSDAWVSVEERSHETEKYQRLWNHLTGESAPLPRPRLMAPDDAMKKAQDFLDAVGLKAGQFIFCFPAGVSNVALKAWPEENFAEVISHLEKKYSLKTLIAGHVDEKDIVDKVADEARCHGTTPERWLGKDGDIPFACALLAQCFFYLGNDTGLMHMAAALEKPVVAIFGGGTWPRFLPVTHHGAALTQELPCTYCLWKDCWLVDAPCCKIVSVDHVLEAIERLLAGTIKYLEVHKGLCVEPSLNTLLEKGYKDYKDLRKDRNDAVEEIHKRDVGLVKLRQDRDTAVEEIHKRDAWLAELRQDRDNAVEEIYRRDAWLAELKQDRDNAVEEIHKRDAWLAQLKQGNEQALRALPLVSIITPVFNGEKWIDNCIQSVLNQDYPKIEHIIVDGKSTDGTLDICHRYPHLIIHSKKDRGQSHAINKGFAMAQGDIMAWLCADDEYEPGAIQKAVKGIIAGNDVVMGYSRFMDAEGNYLSEHPANVHPHYDHDMLLRFWKYGTISQPATFWTRKIWGTCGPIKENLYFAMDYDLWLRMSKKTFFSHIDAYIAKYRIHPDAKCFSDNYGSRLELIEVSRNYWPTKWKTGYWRLLFHYYFSYGGNTKHYADAERLLDAAKENLDNHKRMKAILSFSTAHLIHPATPLMPNYKIVLKRILGEGVGPLWFWRLARKVFYRLTRRTRIRLSAIKNISNSGETVILSVETIGYNNVKFRYWAKNDKKISLLKDWVAENTLIVTEDIDKYREYGVHIKRNKDKDFIDQTWVSVH